MEAITPSIQLVVFTLDDSRFALLLTAVERVVHAVEVTPLPKAPEIIWGVINLRGEVVPVVNVRRRLCLPERDIALRDQFIVARTSRRPVALAADAVSGIVECREQDIIAADAILPGMDYLKGVAKLRDGMVLIHDLDGFLSLDEEESLATAMAGTRNEL